MAMEDSYWDGGKFSRLDKTKNQKKIEKPKKKSKQPMSTFSLVVLSHIYNQLRDVRSHEGKEGMALTPSPIFHAVRFTKVLYCYIGGLYTSTTTRVILTKSSLGDSL